MGPLDLTKHPPRSASVSVDDIAYFPRVIDKIRAEFEGGHLGAYVVLGPDGTSGEDGYRTVLPRNRCRA